MIITWNGIMAGGSGLLDRIREVLMSDPFDAFDFGIDLGHCLEIDDGECDAAD